MTEEEYREKMLEVLGKLAQSLESIDTNLYRIAKQYP